MTETVCLNKVRPISSHDRNLLPPPTLTGSGNGSPEMVAVWLENGVSIGQVFGNFSAYISPPVVNSESTRSEANLPWQVNLPGGGLEEGRGGVGSSQLC